MGCPSSLKTSVFVRLWRDYAETSRRGKRWAKRHRLKKTLSPFYLQEKFLHTLTRVFYQG
jgi:hypothetical protein